LTDPKRLITLKGSFPSKPVYAEKETLEKLMMEKDEIPQ
jgi:hypothetical protein